jgi:uncharacterized membrane protein
MDSSHSLLADEHTRQSPATYSLDDCLLLAGTVFSGLLSGLYFIFSFCVMWSLAKLDAAVAARVMIEINLVILNPFFLTVFMGGPLVCVGLLAHAYCCEGEAKPRASRRLKVAGAWLLLVGEYGVTMVVNVPLNDQLAKVAEDHGMAEAGAFFAGSYIGPWTAWNTVRCFASVGTVVCFALALRLKDVL